MMKKLTFSTMTCKALVLAIYFLFFCSAIYGQNSSRNWEKWVSIPYYDHNHPRSSGFAIEYRMEFDECSNEVSVKNALYNYGYQIRHNLKNKVQIKLRVEGFTCENKKIHDSFHNTSEPGEIKYSPGSDWHSFRSRSRVLSLEVRYTLSPSRFGSTNNEDVFVIEWDWERGISQEWVNNKRIQDALNELEEKERKKKAEEQQKKALEESYNLKILEANNLENSGNLKEASAKYREAMTLRSGDPSIMDKPRQLDLRHERYVQEKTLGDQARVEGRLDDAIGHYENAQKENPNQSQINELIAAVQEEKRITRVEKRHEDNMERYLEQESQKVDRVQQLAAGISLLSMLMFENISEDDPEGVYNPEGRNTFFNFGYGFRSHPIFQETTYETYNGNRTTYYRVLENGNIQPFTIESAIGIRLLRKNFMSFGINADGFVGYGLKTEIVCGGELGGDVNLGTSKVQFVGKGHFGGLYGVYSGLEGEPDYSFISGTTTSSTSSGEMGLRYIKLGIGIKFFFNAWRTKQYIEFMGEFYEPVDYSLSPATGASLTWHASNRMMVRLVFSPTFSRIPGSSTFDSWIRYDELTAYNSGPLFNVRIMRCFDFFRNNR